MSQIGVVHQFFQRIGKVKTDSDLFRLMEDVTHEIGFHHFALINHVDLRRSSREIIRIYNYPRSWAEDFIQEGLYAHDPVLIASLTSAAGFAWSDVPKMIEMTGKQRSILKRAERHGIGDGYTVPAHVPGEWSGSCSFAMKPGAKLPAGNLPFAQLIGTFGFQAARRLHKLDAPEFRTSPRLTARQRDCLVWAIKGKTDWEIAQILGLKKETVSEYLEAARERYGVTKRISLAIRAIFDGQVSFIEALF
jgi:LuxR family quorum-sensing system transcriptional regulator CciR